MMNLNPFETTVFPKRESPPEIPDQYEPSGERESYDLFYSSSIDNIDNLYAGVSYVENGVKKPICVLMHGWNGSASHYHPSKTEEFADYGFFSIAVGMRGRDGAGGSHDANGRELYDIVDAVEYVKNNFPNDVDENNIVVAGYSGGGGNSFGLAAKFPDYFNIQVPHFGLSDVGYDDDYSWWITHENRRSSIERNVGHGRENVGAYWSRAHQYGSSKNFTGGHMFIYHDIADSTVYYTQSTMVADEFEKLNRENYSLDITDEMDDPRWRHQQPDVGSDVIHTRDEWGPLALNNEIPAWVVPEQGEMLIQGYLVTKRFEIWLNDGLEDAAELNYDVDNDSYTITPLTGEVEVTITQGSKTATQSIATETTITVS